MKTLIIGLGNPILSDDGVGIHVAQTMNTLLPKDHSIEITEASLGGVTLMEMMIGYDRVFIIDAYLHQNPRPGTIHRMTLDDLKYISPTQHIASPHDTSLITAIEAGKKLGLPLPEEIVIYAIEVSNVTEFSEQLTTSVAEAIPIIVKTIIDELKLPDLEGSEKWSHQN